MSILKPILHRVVRPMTYNWKTKPIMYFKDTSNAKLVLNNYLRKLYWIRPISFGNFKSKMRVDVFGNVTVTGICLVNSLYANKKYLKYITEGYYPLHYFYDNGLIITFAAENYFEDNGTWNSINSNHLFTWGTDNEYVEIEGVDLRELMYNNLIHYSSEMGNGLDNPQASSSLEQTAYHKEELLRLINNGIIRTGYNGYTLDSEKFTFFTDLGVYRSSNSLNKYSYNSNLYNFNPNFNAGYYADWYIRINKKFSGYDHIRISNFNLRNFKYAVLNGTLTVNLDNVKLAPRRIPGTSSDLLVAHKQNESLSNISSISSINTLPTEKKVYDVFKGGLSVDKNNDGEEFLRDIELNETKIIPVYYRNTELRYGDYTERGPSTTVFTQVNHEQASVEYVSMDITADTLINKNLPTIPWEQTNDNVLLPYSAISFESLRENTIAKYPYSKTYPFIISEFIVNDEGYYGCDDVDPTWYKTMLDLPCNYLNDRLMHYDKIVERPFWRMLALSREKRENDVINLFSGGIKYTNQLFYRGETYNDNIMGNRITIYNGMTVWPESFYPVEFLGVYPYPTTAREKYPHTNYIPRYDGERISHPRQGKTAARMMHEYLRSKRLTPGYVIPINDGYIEDGVTHGDVLYTQDTYDWYIVKDGTKLDVVTIDEETYRNYYTILDERGKLSRGVLSRLVWTPRPAKTMARLARHCVPLRAHTPNQKHLRYTTDISRLYLNLDTYNHMVEVMDVFKYNVDRVEWSGNRQLFTSPAYTMIEGTVFTIYSLDKRLTIKVVKTKSVRIPIDIENLPDTLKIVDYAEHNGRTMYRDETKMFKDRLLHLLNVR